MATTMTSPRPAPPPPPVASSSAASSDGKRIVTIRANLLPDEITSARQADRMRKRVLAGLAALVLLLVAGYGASWWQTRSAQSALNDLQRQSNALQGQQAAFTPLVTVQGKVAGINTRLQHLMTGDVPWRTLLTTLHTVAPAGVTPNQIGAAMNVGAASAGADMSGTGYQSLNQTGQQPVGTLTISGTAVDKRSVADYADKLARVKGLASPYITSVLGTQRSVTFAITAILTTDALGGRYAVAPATPGGN